MSTPGGKKFRSLPHRLPHEQKAAPDERRKRQPSEAVGIFHPVPFTGAPADGRITLRQISAPLSEAVWPARRR